MRDIKSEISDLMTKIDSASRQIYDSFIHKRHEFAVSNQDNAFQSQIPGFVHQNNIKSGEINKENFQRDNGSSGTLQMKRSIETINTYHRSPERLYPINTIQSTERNLDEKLLNEYLTLKKVCEDQSLIIRDLSL